MSRLPYNFASAELRTVSQKAMNSDKGVEFNGLCDRLDAGRDENNGREQQSHWHSMLSYYPAVIVVPSLSCGPIAEIGFSPAARRPGMMLRHSAFRFW